ncbi:thioredoxin fold domain-containing protein [Niabella insulamsoli]|uniref:thioredoxin family protein n=1 Tax=Niabella insulamsoli TaxID=3144874 RepID=UPI0031FC57FE
MKQDTTRPSQKTQNVNGISFKERILQEKGRMARSWLTVAVALLFSIAGYAQGAAATGMNFEHLASWKEVVAKAKRENKMIFLDCYTTWCGPCKVMTSKVFTQPEVGDFYNTHFINAKVQLDTTDNDDAYIKGWYKDGHDIAQKYNVRAYPTYLIFDPQGEIIHRFVGSMSPDAFVAAGQKILDPEHQYYTQVKKFESGDRSAPFLLKLATMSQSAYDKNAKKYIDEYLATQTDYFTKANLDLLYSTARSSKDKGFEIALNEGAKADEVLGRPKASFNLVKGIILNEELGGMLRKLGKDEAPDFASFDSNLKAKYPAYADYVSAFSKMYYYRSKKNWPEFAENVDKLIKIEAPSGGELNSYAWFAFENIADKAILEKAASWSKLSLEKEANAAAYIDTHANLLYKIGEKDAAIKEEERALSVAEKNGEDTSGYKEIIEKMKKGEPTWPEKIVSILN